jgi:ARC6-like, IMS domain
MQPRENHYDLLGVDMFAPRTAIEAAVERISKQANAMANTDPAHSQQLRNRIRQVKEDLLEGEERRNIYNRRILDLQREEFSGADSLPLTAEWRTDESPRARRVGSGVFPRAPESAASGYSAAPSAPPSSDRLTPVLIGAAVAVAILIVAGTTFALVRQKGGSTPAIAPPTAAPTIRPLPPTATPPPTPDPTQVAQRALAEVKRAVRLSNDRWSASMQCACDQGLEQVKMGGDLQNYLNQIQVLQSKSEHWLITLYSFTIASAQLDSSNSATAYAWKNELHQLYQGSALVSSCANPYEVRYHLARQNGTWKVDATSVTSGGC